MTSSPLNFITQPNEKSWLIKVVFGSDFRYEIRHDFIPDYQGDEREILTLKCRDAVASGIPCPIVVDVTSVSFNALGGLPGPLITSVMEHLNPDELYRLLAAFEDKSAYVKYSLGLLEEEDSDIEIFQGYLSGTVVKPKMSDATSWEACFQPDGFCKTYAELPNNVQVDICERKKALRIIHYRKLKKEHQEETGGGP